MNDKALTDAELLILGLVAEIPRHGYELEKAIEDRAMREWTQIGFSSIYFVLGKLQKAGLVAAEKGASKTGRKTFSITSSGERVLKSQTLAALATHRPTYPSAMLGMVNWDALSRSDALDALTARACSIAEESERLERIRQARQPQPDHIEVLFDLVSAQLEAEASWVQSTLSYMQSKPWTE